MIETMNNANAMKPSLMKSALKTLVAARRPAFIWGAPGVGKSQVVKQVCDELKIDMIDVRAVLLDPVDLRGLPTVSDDDRAHWAIPEFLPRKGKGVLFLDELNAAPPLTQAACYQLILDRKLGEYELPPGWIAMAAGNREGDRAVTSKMPTALSNRFVHLDFVVDVDDWCTWAIEHELLTELIAFIRFRPELLHQFDPKSGSKAFPTPRSWEFVSDILKSEPDKEIEYPLLAGTVGDGPAAELEGFLRIYRNLPSVEGILMDPKGEEVPTDPATLYALSGALARRADDGNFDRVKLFADRMPAEFGVLLVSDAVKRCKAIQHTRAFVDWATENASVVL